MKKLPKIYKEDNLQIKVNNKTKCIVELNNEEYKDNNLNIINDIFSGLGYPFNVLLTIKTKKEEKTTSLIGKTEKAIITLDNEIIPIAEILSITRKKN
ncbi:MAG: hypothetical protein J6C28_03595 [Bacilli bacterium]|nr:hypothetical protein [Bacilli bacterium]